MAEAKTSPQPSAPDTSTPGALPACGPNPPIDIEEVNKQHRLESAFSISEKA